IPLDSIWIRDYGAEVVFDDATGQSRFIDMGYYSGESPNCITFPGRPNDDVSPTRYAPRFLGGVAVHGPQLRTEGGNVAPAGNGTCIHMRRVVLQQNNFSRWMYSQADLDAVYTQYYNCNRVITLESLVNDPFGFRVIDHVDVMMTFLSPTKF